MKMFRLVLATCLVGVTSGVGFVNAATPSAVGAIPEIGIVSQPFHVLTSVNSRFVLDANVSTRLDRNDKIEFLLHRRVVSRDSFISIAKGDVVPGVSDSYSLALSRVDRDFAGQLLPIVPIITEDRQSSAISILQDGIYPLSIQIVDFQTKNILSSTLTFINRRTLSATQQSIAVSPLLRLETPGLLNTDGIIELDDATRQSVQRLVSFMGSFASPLTISISPQIIAALAESAIPSDVQLFLELKNQLRRRSIATDTFAPCNPAVFAGLGLQDEFIAQMKLGEATLNLFLPGVKIQRTTWVASERLDPNAIALLRRAGITNLLLSNQAGTDSSTEASSSMMSQPVGEASKEVTVTSDLSPLRTTSSVLNSTRQGISMAAEAIVQGGDVLANALDPSMARVLIPLPIASRDDFAVANTTARAVATAPGFVMTDMAEPANNTAPRTSIAFGEPSKEWDTSRVASIQRTRVELNAVSSMLTENDTRRYTWSYLLGVGASPTIDNASSYILSLRQQLRATRRSITVTTPSNLNLSSRNGSIRVQLRNESAEDLMVRVRLNSAKLSLVNPSRIITLPAGSSTEVVVSATTRTSGSFPISVWVATPQGNLEVVPLITIRAKVTAIAGFGQFVSLSFLLILFAWWWSHRRSARRQVSEPTTV